MVLPMTKLKNPLMSLKASGSLARIITFVTRHGVDLAEKKPEIKDVRSLAQLSWRHMYQKAVALWHALSVAEKQQWESDARPRHMTGFAWFMSQCLRPNPGIYLPLQGGTMAGDIDMAGHAITDLPDPTNPQDAATKAYADAPGTTQTKGARVYHGSNQSIPDDTDTILAFDRERYDTDAIHSTTVNNSRLTCKTGGKYLIIAHGRFAPNVAGRRILTLLLNGAHKIVVEEHGIEGVIGQQIMVVATIYRLLVNDYVECQVYQNTGGALIFSFSVRQSPEFMMQRIG